MMNTIKSPKHRGATREQMHENNTTNHTAPNTADREQQPKVTTKNLPQASRYAPAARRVPGADRQGSSAKRGADSPAGKVRVGSGKEMRPEVTSAKNRQKTNKQPPPKFDKTHKIARPKTAHTCGGGNRTDLRAGRKGGKQTPSSGLKARGTKKEQI